MTTNIIYKEESYAIQGAIFEVYREMGCGFLESVFQECLEKEFSLRDIPFEPQSTTPIYYKGEKLKQKFTPDFICYNKIIVEIKAIKTTTEKHEAQVINYLNASKLKLGILANFGAYPKATVKRFAL